MNFKNNFNLYNYTESKNMSAINEILLNVIPSELVNEVMKYDAHTCCMKEIREREKKEYVLQKTPLLRFGCDNILVNGKCSQSFCTLKFRIYNWYLLGLINPVSIINQ